jgi:hypothetical protein
LLVIGGLLFIAWCVWDGFFARYPIMPKQVFNRTFLGCIGINFMYYFSGYCVDVYWSSWVYIIVSLIKDFKADRKDRRHGIEAG